MVSILSGEDHLVERCGDSNEVCVAAVKEQIESCMIQANWKGTIDNEDDTDFMSRFVSQFYSCFRGENGDPYFPGFNNI